MMLLAVNGNRSVIMKKQFLARASAILLAASLSACGGGENSNPLAGSPNGDSSTGSATNQASTEAGSIDLVASPIRIYSSDSARSSITARVKDSNGVLLEGVLVNFSTANGGTLEVTQSETDQAGVASATLMTAGDYRNRTIQVSAQSGSVTNNVNIEITGTEIAINAPSSVSLGSTTSIQINLSDSEGNGIPNQPVNITSTLGNLSATSLTTNANGVVTADLSSGSTSGTATITATAFSGDSTLSTSQNIEISSDRFGFSTPTNNAEINIGTTQELALEWIVDGTPIADGTEVQFSTSRGTLTPANGTVTTSGGIARIDISSDNAGLATVTASETNGLSTDLSLEFVATNPDEISLQATKTQLDLGASSEIIAVIRDANNNLVKNQDVTFRIVTDGSGGYLATSRDTTDSQGRASTVYQAGSNTSGRDGVIIEATVAGSITDSVTITVARQALRLAVGTGNQIEEPDSVRYRKDYVAIVTDANGAPIEGAEIELSVLPVGYAKGSYEAVDNKWRIPNSVYCPAEDANRDGQLDAGEDINSNGTLEPTNSAATSAPFITTSADGSADFSLLYPQSHCNWVGVELTATVRVGGSESVEKSEFFLSCLASDLNNTNIIPPGGTEGLYGSELDCTSPY
ncbi:Ig-like domain-containing protein [Marinobacter sp. chi1]|uniref:Ig-like domain-containing protein n=1 Tax=Marinobacter suaedae TaxID=3057675 RepID=A0ABT8W4Q9_9GAMM|nr:Ig-like domain-containing protein [Marinobacter sp. chi1]MDO3723235.1 Ig-like domain-containing protein [Marinobacter sp. chi1]